ALIPHYSSDSSFFMYPGKMRDSSPQTEVLDQPSSNLQWAGEAKGGKTAQVKLSKDPALPARHQIPTTTTDAGGGAAFNRAAQDRKQLVAIFVDKRMKCNVSEEGDRDRETSVNMMTKIAKMYCSGAAGAASRRGGEIKLAEMYSQRDKLVGQWGSWLIGSGFGIGISAGAAAATAAVNTEREEMIHVEQETPKPEEIEQHGTPKPEEPPKDESPKEPAWESWMQGGHGQGSYHARGQGAAEEERLQAPDSRDLAPQVTKKKGSIPDVPETDDELMGDAGAAQAPCSDAKGDDNKKGDSSHWADVSEMVRPPATGPLKGPTVRPSSSRDYTVDSAEGIMEKAGVGKSCTAMACVQVPQWGPTSDMKTIEKQTDEMAKQAKQQQVLMREMAEKSLPADVAKKMRELEVALENNNIVSRSDIYQKYQRHLQSLPEEEKKKHKGTTIQKRQFRLEWAKLRLTEMEKKYFHYKSYETVNTRTGIYMSFPRVAQEEGGHHAEANVIAARNYCSSCALLGGDWVYWGPMSQRQKFLCIEISQRQATREKWEISTQFNSAGASGQPIIGNGHAPTIGDGQTPGNGLPAIGIETPAEEGAPPSKRRKTAGALTEAKQEPPEEPREEPKQSEKKALTEEEKQFKRDLLKAENSARALVSKYTLAMGVADTAKNAAKSKQEWKWLADNDAEQKRYQERIDEVMNSKPSFFERLLAEDTKDVKKGISSENLLNEYRNIAKRTYHRNPLLDIRILGTGIHTFSLDELHCLHLGVFKNWAGAAVWRLIDANVWGVAATLQDMTTLEGMLHLGFLTLQIKHGGLIAISVGLAFNASPEISKMRDTSETVKLANVQAQDRKSGGASRVCPVEHGTAFHMAWASANRIGKEMTSSPKPNTTLDSFFKGRPLELECGRSS
ncbi:unnamed protein product, partial [Prorocentrum cordatum]